MASLGKRLRQRSDRKPVYTVDDSDSDDQTTKQVEDIIETEPVNPLKEIDKILDFAFRPALSVDPHPDNGEPNLVFVPQYLVKWKGLSYLHCSWVPEEEFEKAYKYNPGLQTRVTEFHSKKSAESKYEDKSFGIRPEWTTVDRIIACREEGDVKKYLVKFKGLTYDESYWEVESNISTFQKEIQRFKDINSGTRRDRVVNNEIYQEFKQFDNTPNYIKGSLHPYQVEGLNFLMYSWSEETNVILADEMGLGKAIQSIAFLASLIDKNVAPHLVVAPLSTLRNWEREFAVWTPQLNVVVYTGTYKAREVIREHDLYFPEEEKKTKFDVLLTSYEMINLDTAFLKSFKWNCMIVDEGYMLKIKDSKFFTSLNQYNSWHRVLLTGSPLENNLSELIVLMHFVDAGKFGRLETYQEELEDLHQEEKISNLQKMLAPHILRRVATDVLKRKLSLKKELILRVDLTSQQKHFYKDIITRNHQILADKKVCKLSNVMMELRKVCSHPYLVEGHQLDIEDTNEAFKQFLEASGKLQMLDQLMMKLKEQGHKVLIYCHFQRMLDLLEYYCKSKNWFYERVDGMVDEAERQVRIDRFNAENSKGFCFLLSTTADGLGSNLATADTVIIYDSEFYPHSDIQALAGAFRLGQTEKVMIYRLINRGTVEEKMMSMTKKVMLLEHIFLERLRTGPHFCQEKLDDFIKHGTKKLFSEEDEEAGNSGRIHYDDASIEKLLDRDQVDAEDNDFLKPFKVANFECIDENEDATLELPPPFRIEKPYPERIAERKSYWKELLKDSVEMYQAAEELSALGKRKRICKELILMEEDDLEKSYEENDEAEPSAGKATEQRSPKSVTRSRRRGHERDISEPRPLMEGEGEFLRVLGFNQNERKTFKFTVMRYGIGNSNLKEFVSALKSKSFAEIKAYGILFMKHLLESSTNTSQTFGDGVPKEGLNSSETLIRIGEILLFQEKCQFLEKNPTKTMFSEPIIKRFGLEDGRFWKEEHDKKLIRAVIKNGFGKWTVILTDKEFRFEELVRQEMRYLSSTNKSEVGESSSVNQTSGSNNALADASQSTLMKPNSEVITKPREFVGKRVNLLKKAMNYEYAEVEYFESRRYSSSLPAGQAESETKVMDTAGEMLDRVPETESINLDEISTAAAAAGFVEKEGRVAVAKLYNQMCMNPNENSGKSIQLVSPMVKENIRLVEGSSQEMSRKPSGGMKDNDVEMKDLVEEAGPSSSKCG